MSDLLLIHSLGSWVHLGYKSCYISLRVYKLHYFYDRGIREDQILHKNLAVRLLIKAIRDLDFSFVPRQRLVRLGLTCQYPESLLYLSRPRGHSQASRSPPKLPRCFPPPCPWSRTPFQSRPGPSVPVPETLCKCQSLALSLALPSGCTLDLYYSPVSGPDTFYFWLGAQGGLWPWCTTYCVKVVDGPFYQPLALPDVLRSCGTVARHWRHSLHWGHSWLTLFLEEPHSCCFLTTNHYTVDESGKWVICLFLWKLMYMTFCQIATLFHSRSLDPPLSALSTFYFFPWLQSEDNPLVFFKRNYDTDNSTMCTSICLRVITLPLCCRGYINTTPKWTRHWMIKYGMCLLCPRLVPSWAKCMNHAFWMQISFEEIWWVYGPET